MTLSITCFPDSCVIIHYLIYARYSKVLELEKFQTGPTNVILAPFGRPHMISYSMSYTVSQILRLIYENDKGS